MPSVDRRSLIDPLARAWAQRVTAARASAEHPTTLETLAKGWLALLLSGREEDAPEVVRQVAFHARNLGAEGHPASRSILQMVFLRDLLSASLSPEEAPVERSEELLRVAADAHATGASQRQAARFRRERIESSVVIRLPGIAVVGFAPSTDDADLIDALVGRLLRTCAGRGETHAVLDVSGAPTEDALLHRTLAGFGGTDAATRYTLIVTGLVDPAATRSAVQNMGGPVTSLAFADSLSSWLTDRLHGSSQTQRSLRGTHTGSQSRDPNMGSVGRPTAGRRPRKEKPR